MQYFCTGAVAGCFVVVCKWKGSNFTKDIPVYIIHFISFITILLIVMTFVQLYFYKCGEMLANTVNQFLKWDSAHNKKGKQGDVN